MDYIACNHFQYTIRMIDSKHHIKVTIKLLLSSSAILIIFKIHLQWFFLCDHLKFHKQNELVIHQNQLMLDQVLWRYIHVTDHTTSGNSQYYQKKSKTQFLSSCNQSWWGMIYMSKQMFDIWIIHGNVCYTQNMVNFCVRKCELRNRTPVNETGVMSTIDLNTSTHRIMDGPETRSTTF